MQYKSEQFSKWEEQRNQWKNIFSFGVENEDQLDQLINNWAWFNAMTQKLINPETPSVDAKCSDAAQEFILKAKKFFRQEQLPKIEDLKELVLEKIKGLTKSNKQEPTGYAEVLTWGTIFQGGNGLSAQIHSMLTGGNIGHAAIRLTIPIDPAGKAKQLINDYCFQDNKLVLPHIKKTFPNGQKVFEVYISAWSDDEVTLDRDFIIDSMDERIGVHFNWDPKWEDEFKPEKRSYEGLYSRTVMHLGPEEIVHQRGGISDEQFKTFLTIKKYQLYLKRIKDFNTLESRIKLISPKMGLGDTEKILLNRLLPGWQKKLSKSPITKVLLIKMIDEAKDNYIKDATNMEIFANVKKLAEDTLIRLETSIKDDLKKWGKITPKTAQSILENKILIKLDNKITLAELTNYSAVDIRDLNDKIHTSVLSGPTGDDLKNHYEKYQPSDQHLLDTSFTYGLSPAHIVQIPLQSLTEPKNKTALDAKAMLQRAKQVATSDEKFALNGTNCAKVAGWVLQAGAQDSSEAKIFNREALESYATPQMVFNNSIKYLHQLSKKSKEDYHQELELQLQDENQQKQTPILGFKEISFDGIDLLLSPIEQCIALLDKFEIAIKSGDDIPYLTNDVKGRVEVFTKRDPHLEKRFAALCESAIIKAYKQSVRNQHEWTIVNELMENIDPPQKISKKDVPILSYSYVILDIDDEKKAYRVSQVLGTGNEGVLKILENQQGGRLAVKGIEDEPSLDRNVAIMKEAGAAITDFIRKREKKPSKSLGRSVGDLRYIVQPLHKGMEVQQLVQSKLTQIQKLTLAKKCCESIQNLHDRRILHRDIKGTNFIASRDEMTGNIESVNIIDFGGAIKTNENGIVNAKPFGSPGYMAPELGRNEILQAGRKWQMQLKIAKQHGDLIIEAQNYLDTLQNEKRKLKGELSNTRDMILNTLSKKNTDFKQVVDNILKGYDGKNQAEILDKALKLANNNLKGMIGSLVTTYCSTVNQLNLIKTCIQFYDNKINEHQKSKQDAEISAAKQKEKLDNEFKKDVVNSFASDVYALGVMLKNEFKLNLTNLGLADMLHEQPEERPDVERIIRVLDKNLRIEEIENEEMIAREQQELVKPSRALRLPTLVTPELQTSEIGELSLLSADDLKELSLHKEKNNAYFVINGKTIFLTQNGDAFAMYCPIRSGGTSSTFLVQNVNDRSWSVLKMVKGMPHKIRGQLEQFKNEREVLNNLHQLQGTLELNAANEIMYISIQPYVFGKTYADIINDAKKNEQGLALPDAVMMFSKALESLADFHNNQRYLHRDIKSENIIWDSETNLCTLIDFGCAAKGNDIPLEIQDITKRGTELYQAPELEFDKLMKRDRKYTEKTDAYSLGVIFQEILSVVKASNHPAYLQLKNLQAALMDTNPDNRPSPNEALQHQMAIAKQLLSSVAPPVQPIPEDKVNSVPPRIILDDILISEPHLAPEPLQVPVEIKKPDPQLEKRSDPFNWMQRFETIKYLHKGKILTGEEAILEQLLSRNSSPNNYMLVRKKNIWPRQPEWCLYHLNNNELVKRRVDQDPSLQELKDIIQEHTFSVASMQLKYRIQVTIDEFFYNKTCLTAKEQQVARTTPQAIQKIHSSPWDHNQDVRKQAKHIWKNYVKERLKRGEKIALLYSANQKQAKQLYESYDHFDTSLSDIFAHGSGQAKLFKEIALLIEKKQCRDKVHILPIPTSLGGGDNREAGNEVALKHIDIALKNVAEHKGAGFNVLSLADENDRYLLGGGRSKGWDDTNTTRVLQFENGYYQQRVDKKNPSNIPPKTVKAISQGRYTVEHLNGISSGQDALLTLNRPDFHEAYEKGINHPERLCLFKTSLTENLIKHLLLLNQASHPLINQMYHVVDQYKNHKNAEIVWRALAKVCKTEEKSLWKMNSPEMDLLIRAIAEFDVNLRQWPEITTVDELLIAQQKRDAIRNVIEKDISRLAKIDRGNSATQNMNIEAKLNAYELLVKEIKRSDTNTTLNTLLSENSYVLSQTVVVNTKQGRKNASIESILNFNRGFQLLKSTSKSALDTLRDQLTKMNPKTAWQKIKIDTMKLVQKQEVIQEILDNNFNRKDEQNQLKLNTCDALLTAKNEYLERKRSEHLNLEFGLKGSHQGSQAALQEK